MQWHEACAICLRHVTCCDTVTDYTSVFCRLLQKSYRCCNAMQMAFWRGKETDLISITTRFWRWSARGLAVLPMLFSLLFRRRLLRAVTDTSIVRWWKFAINWLIGAGGDGSDRLTAARYYVRGQSDVDDDDVITGCHARRRPVRRAVCLSTLAARQSVSPSVRRMH